MASVLSAPLVEDPEAPAAPNPPKRALTAKLTEEQRHEIDESQYNRKSFRFWRARIIWQQRMNPFASQVLKYSGR